ncbi:response regulator transcription factor [Streptomyces violaceus]|uniref:response regulator transcription factor n=2 Tax=Streptomyces TaxID=1883 RepID=UPI0031EBDC59
MGGGTAHGVTSIYFKLPLWLVLAPDVQPVYQYFPTGYHSPTAGGTTGRRATHQKSDHDRGKYMGSDQGRSNHRFPSDETTLRVGDPGIDGSQFKELTELTSRELEVLSLLVTGDSNRRLAHRLGIAERTVKAHLTSLMRKLGVESRVEAALLAQRSQKALSDLGAIPKGPMGERGLSCKGDT